MKYGPRPKVETRRNLLTGDGVLAAGEHTLSTTDSVVTLAETTATEPEVPLWRSNVSLALVYDVSAYAASSIPPQLSQCMSRSSPFLFLKFYILDCFMSGAVCEWA